MVFQVGSWVKFKSVAPIRLGYALSDIGKVIGVYDGSEADHEIDVEFGDGQVVHGAAGEWFEPAGQPAEH